MRTNLVLLALSTACFHQTAFAQTEVGNLSKDAIIKCADAGIAECQFRLARMTEEGTEVQKDVATARQLYETAYRSGYEPAGADILRLSKNQKPAATTGQSHPASMVDNGVALPAFPQAQPIAPQFNRLTFSGRSAVPGIGPGFLGQTEREFLSAVPQAKCERTSDGYRTCEATLGQGASEVDYSAMFDGERVAAIFAMVAAQCTETTLSLDARYPKLPPVRTKLMAAIALKQLAKELPPNMEVTAFAKNGAWSALTLCDADGSGLVVFANGDMQGNR